MHVELYEPSGAKPLQGQVSALWPGLTSERGRAVIRILTDFAHGLATSLDLWKVNENSNFPKVDTSDIAECHFLHGPVMYQAF